MDIWTKKYQPKSSGEVIGQGLALSRIRNFIEGYKGGSLLVYGPSGTGKSCSVYAIAKEMNCEVIEVNSSDVRNKDALARVVGGSSVQASLFMKKKVILIDEVDGISGVSDRGGVAELVDIIKGSYWPIIMTSNDAYSEKLKPLRKVATPVEFSVLDASDIFFRLRDICEREGVSCEDDLLRSLSWQSGGDLRSAITDLQNLAVVDNSIKSLDSLGGRMQRKKIDDALRLVFKSTSAADTLNIFDDVDIDLDDCLLWLDENLPREYSGCDLANAYECLSRADVFRGRIRRWQHWRFLVYINALLTAGVAVSKGQKNSKAVEYRRSLRILNMWQAKIRNAKRAAVSDKVATGIHCSSKYSFAEVVPYLRIIFQRGGGQDIAREFAFDEEELGWLRA